MEYLSGLYGKMFVTYRKGEIAQLKVQQRAAELGVLVSKPTTEARYDLVLDFGSRIERAQVKYAGALENHGSVGLDLRKQTRNHGPVRAYSALEIDAVYVYVAPVDEVVRLGPELFDGVKRIYFRWLPAKRTNQRKALNVHEHVWRPATY